MSDILTQGKLRERVKRGDVNATEARQALLTLQRQGEVVSQDALRWLANFRPRKAKVEEATEEQPKKNKRRRRQRRQRGQ